MVSKIRKQLQSIHRDVDGFFGHFFARSPYISKVSNKHPEGLTPENFDVFTYSKSTHFQNFRMMPVYQKQTITTCDLKVYQDLFVHTFILNNIPKGSRILELGGGNSRIISCLKDDYEFWNLDKLEGQGHGPKGAVAPEGFSLVRDYIGTFSEQLPNHYFDLVYSISAMEHFSTEKEDMEDILQDIRRLLNQKAYCLHCVDALIFEDHLWVHPIIDLLSSEINGVMVETDFTKITSDNALWTLPKYAFYTRWYPITKRRLSEFGRPFSINMFWKTSG